MGFTWHRPTMIIGATGVQHFGRLSAWTSLNATHSLSGWSQFGSCVTCALKLFTFQSIIMVMTPSFSFVFRTKRICFLRGVQRHSILKWIWQKGFLQKIDSKSQFKFLKVSEQPIMENHTLCLFRWFSIYALLSFELWTLELLEG